MPTGVPYPLLPIGKRHGPGQAGCSSPGYLLRNLQLDERSIQLFRPVGVSKRRNSIVDERIPPNLNRKAGVPRKTGTKHGQISDLKFEHLLFLNFAAIDAGGNRPARDISDISLWIETRNVGFRHCKEPKCGMNGPD